MTSTPPSSTTTPLFSISQTDKTLTLDIRAPHSRPHDIEVSAEGSNFTFFCNPYSLRLTFDHSVYLHHPLDAPPQHTAYDFTTGVAHVTLHKTAPGTHFDKLGLLSTILHDNPGSPSGPQPFAAPSIEVISSTTSHNQSLDKKTESDQLCSPSESLSGAPAVTRTFASLNQEFANTANIHGLEIPLRELTLSRPKYGFAARYEAVFAIRAEDASQIVLLPHPDTTPVWRRPALRKASEDAKFDSDHFIADFLLEHEFAHALAYERRKREPVVEGLDKLPRREYLSEVDQRAASDLAGILFASAYDERITSGERNIESAWTISRLSPTMAFLEQMQSPREAILAAYRRSLVYPLYRSLKLADCVLDDVKAVFDADTSASRAALLSILMELRALFEEDQLLRLHCDLFLIDYCVWIQNVDDRVIEDLSKKICDVVIERHELEWDLDSLEHLAHRLATGEEMDVDEEVMVDQVKDTEGGETRTPRNDIVITAQSAVPSPGLACIPLRSTVLKPPTKYGPPDGSSTSSEYDSESTCTTASSSDSPDSLQRRDVAFTNVER